MFNLKRKDDGQNTSQHTLTHTHHECNEMHTHTSEKWNKHKETLKHQDQEKLQIYNACRFIHLWKDTKIQENMSSQTNSHQQTMKATSRQSQIHNQHKILTDALNFSSDEENAQSHTGTLELG